MVPSPYKKFEFYLEPKEFEITKECIIEKRRKEILLPLP